MTADLASPPPEAHAAATAPDTAPTTPLRTLRVTEQPLPRGLDGDWGPAPCDFARLYRGRVGEASVSVLLRRPDERSDVVTGRAHYDRTLGLAIDGKVDPKTGTFSLRETPGGTFEGRCDPATGALVGHHRLAGRKLPFSLEPRPAAWPGLHQLERTTERMPDPEVCRGRASRTRPVEVSLDPNDPDADTITCPPTERSAREAFFRDDPGARCEARDVGVRVFGLDDVTIEGRLNAELAAASGYALNVDELRDCPGRWSLESDATLLFADAHVIVTSGFSSRWYGAGAHPLNGGTGLVVLDRRSGRVLALEQVIRDVDALRDRVALLRRSSDGLRGRDAGGRSPRRLRRRRGPRAPVGLRGRPGVPGVGAHRARRADRLVGSRARDGGARRERTHPRLRRASPRGLAPRRLPRGGALGRRRARRRDGAPLRRRDRGGRLADVGGRPVSGSRARAGAPWPRDVHQA
jgi:hypothetical protein